MDIKLNRYHGGKRRALTLSYDDGGIQDVRLIEIMNKYGIKGTFHLNSGTFDTDGKVSAKQVTELYSGHEISAHTLTHPDICACNYANLREEILTDRENLENLAGYIVRGMSYPFGTYSKHVMELLPALGIEYSRTVVSQSLVSPRKFRLPENFMEWHPSCHHNEDALNILDEFKVTPDWMMMPLFYLWGHSYEFDNDDNWDMIEEFCKRASGDEDIWYASNIEVYDYICAVKSLKFSVDNTRIYNSATISVWIEAYGETIEIKPGLNIIK